MCYDRSNLWLAHSSVWHFPACSALGPNRVSSAPILIQRLARRPVHRRSGRLRPAGPSACLPSAGSQAGRGLLTRSGNAAFRRQPPQTAQAGRGLHTAPTPDPTAARSDVAEVAKGGGVGACLPATAGGHQISHSETFDNSLSLNDPPNIGPPNIDRP